MSRQLPQGFIDLLSSYGRPDLTNPLLSALSDTEASISVRLNRRKNITFAIDGERVPWLADSGMYLDTRPNFALDPAWHQGLYYVQDASSMAMTAAVREVVERFFDNKPLRYLDACAAPGGKSIAAAEALPAGSCILSNEYDPKRASILAENIAKYGMANTAVSQGDTSAMARLGEVFDIVAVDAPCSGEGMMRKEPDAIAQWSPGLIESCARLQREILANCWKALRPGGVMIYSTCTFNKSEDESNLDFIINELGGESVDLLLDKYPGVICGLDTGSHCYRFMPGHVRGEGLFIAAVRKADGPASTVKAKKAAAVKAPDVEALTHRLIKGNEEYSLRQDKSGLYYAIPTKDSVFFDLVADKLRLISCGLPICTRKGKDLIPAWQLALNEHFDITALPTLPLDRSEALRYLHGESLASVPDDLPKGIATATYCGRPLGFIKNIGRRANNLYPDALRLRLDPAKGIDNNYLSIVKP